MNLKLSPQQIKDQNKEVFNEIAPQYDSNTFFDISAQYMVDNLIGESHQNMLDVAAGTGAISLRVSKKYPDIKITAVDQSIGMLIQAKNKIREAGLHPKIFLCQDVEKINFPMASFDLITCGYGMFFFPDMEKTFLNLFNSLQEDGLLVFSIFKEEAFQPCTDIFLDTLGRFDVKIPKMTRGRLNSVEKINALCESVGIKKCITRFLEIRYEIEVEGWWDLLNSAGYKGLLNQVNPDAATAFKEEHLRNVVDRVGGKKVLLNADTIFGIVKKL